MLKIFKHDKNITKFSLYPLSKTRKGCCCFVNTSKKGDGMFIVLKTKILREYRGKGIKFFKN